MDIENQEYLNYLIDNSCESILRDLKQRKITKKKIHNLILTNLKKKTKPKSKPKNNIKAMRVPLYISESSSSD